MGVTYIPYNPASDPSQYLSEGVRNFLSEIMTGKKRDIDCLFSKWILRDECSFVDGDQQ